MSEPIKTTDNLGKWKMKVSSLVSFANFPPKEWKMKFSEFAYFSVSV